MIYVVMLIACAVSFAGGWWLKSEELPAMEKMTREIYVNMVSRREWQEMYSPSDIQLEARDAAKKFFLSHLSTLPINATSEADVKRYLRENGVEP